MPAGDKPEKKKAAKPKAEVSSELMRPGLERRLRAATPDKSPARSQSVSLKELIATVRSAKTRFTLATVEIVEYEHLVKTKNCDQAEKLALAVEREINAQLRQDDLVAYAGGGKFFIYLPETAKIESTMVLERLSRQISKRNQRRPVAPQVSISFKLVDAEVAKNETILQASRENDRYANWLQRFQFKSNSSLTDDSEWREIKAKDTWKNSNIVLIKRFDFTSESQQTRQHSAQVLSTIQTNGLPLFPQLLDFCFSNGSLCLVTEPFSDYREAGKCSSAKGSHNLLISICDLYAHLDVFDLPPPKFKLDSILIARNEIDSVLDCLDKHLIAALQNDSKWNGHEESAGSILQVIAQIAKIHPQDECFSTAQELLRKATSKKALIGAVQKIRALVKRHEERLRRIQSGASKVSD